MPFSLENHIGRPAVKDVEQALLARMFGRNQHALGITP